MATTKLCPRCQRSLPRSAFNFRDKEHRRIQSYCRDCSNRAWRDWYRVPTNRAHHLEVLRRRRRRRIERNRALVRHLKSRPCADCRQRFPPEAMDFDHREGKEEVISKLVYTVGNARLLREIAKCEVVCAICHRIRTRARLTGGRP